MGVMALAAIAQARGGARRNRLPATIGPSPPLVRPWSVQSRQLHASAALLAGAVLADSALEHYRGNFENPGMLTPLLASALTAVAGGKAACATPSRLGANRAVYLAATWVGAAGLGFHLYNVRKRAGGVNWQNVFYAAPLGAPAALSLAGLIGLAARRVGETPAGAPPRWLGLPASQALSALAGLGLAGTAGEAALLHFRGAFQNHAMWLPVTLPPVASALMAAAAIRPPDSGRRRLVTRAWLAVTAVVGMAGMVFHARGVARQMGGWRNWSQNLLSGPPLPAPPSFSALALAGLSALSLSQRGPKSGARL